MDTALRAAVALHRSGRLAEAEQVYTALAEQNPDHPDLLHLIGLVHAQTGRNRTAIRFMAQAAALNPASATYRGNLQAALRRANDEEQADAFAEASDALLDKGRGEAVPLARTALLLRPDSLTRWFNLGIALRDHGHSGPALRAFRHARALAPALLRTALEIGSLCHAARDFAGARQAFLDAWTRQPSSGDAWLGLANAVKGEGDFAEASTLYRRALALQPDRTDGWYNLAVTLADQERADDAIAAYRRAVRLAPGNADIRCNLAHQLLLTGRYGEGWRAFEWRFKAGVPPPPDRGRRRWRGEPLEGRTLLLYGEQGQGDTLQFVRYAALAAARGGRVVVEAPHALVRLMATVPGVSAAHPLGEAPDFDLICPMLSLPLIFGTEVSSIPAAVPYMAGRFPGDERFDRVFPDDGVRRVGLVWSGEPRPEDRRWSFADRRRSIPLRAFAPLLGTPGLRFYSLQKGGAAEQAREAPFDRLVIDPMGGVEDFADTASIVRRLDLVISVDTAVAHLAGALDRPVWLLSRFDGCWRWLAGREDSPWYPGMRVFRQPRLEHWGPVLERVAGELRRWAAV